VILIPLLPPGEDRDEGIKILGLYSLTLTLSRREREYAA
jgi:hypothetical protein